jgi:hypothetical protein
MPIIDYSKTKIYKIQCRDESVQDVFYGHSTYIHNVKYRLKNDIENGKNTHICNTIRENGGIENWKVHIMETYTDCKNKKQADYRVTVIKHQNNPLKTIQNNPATIQNNPATIQNNPTTIQVNQDDDPINQKSESSGLFNCKLCNKTFTLKTNLYRHTKHRCIKRKSINTYEYNEIQTLKLQLKEQEEKIKKLEEQNKSSLVSIDTQNNTTQNTIQNQNNIQNQTNNITQNNIIFELGSENFEKILTHQDKMQILNQKYSSIEYFIKKYHCNNKYPQFQNVKIPSMTKSHCEVYSKKDKKYITKDLKRTIEQLVDYRIGDLHIILEDTPNVPENTDKAMRGLFEKMDTDEDYKKEKYKTVKMTIYSEFRKNQP